MVNSTTEFQKMSVSVNTSTRDVKIWIAVHSWQLLMVSFSVFLLNIVKVSLNLTFQLFYLMLNFATIVLISKCYFMFCCNFSIAIYSYFIYSIASQIFMMMFIKGILFYPLKIILGGTFLVIQWLRIHLPMWRYRLNPWFRN